MVLHSPKNSGGTRIVSSNKVVCFFSLGVKSTCIKADKVTMTKYASYSTPTWNSITMCTRKDDIMALMEPNKNKPSTFNGSAVFFPAPFISDAVFKADMMDF